MESTRGERFMDMSGLMGAQVRAADGALGRVTDALFDEVLYVVRYLEILTGDPGLPGRHALLSRQALAFDAGSGGPVEADVKREEVLSSPETSRGRDVTRSEQRALHEHHGWRRYWREDEYRMIPTTVERDRGELQRVSDLFGFEVRSLKGIAVGQVVDLVLGERSWAIHGVRLDVAGRDEPVEVAPETILSLSPGKRRIRVELTADQIGP